MALFYEYHFSHKERTKIIYAASEVEARKKFQEIFGVPAKDLLRRKNW